MGLACPEDSETRSGTVGLPSGALLQEAPRAGTDSLRLVAAPCLLMTMICTKSCKEPNLWRLVHHESELPAHLAHGLPSVHDLRFADISTCLLSQGEAKACSHWSRKLWSWVLDKWLAFMKASSFGRAGLVSGLTPLSLS